MSIKRSVRVIGSMNRGAQLCKGASTFIVLIRVFYNDYRYKIPLFFYLVVARAGDLVPAEIKSARHSLSDGGRGEKAVPGAGPGGPGMVDWPGE